MNTNVTRAVAVASLCALGAVSSAEDKPLLEGVHRTAELWSFDVHTEAGSGLLLDRGSPVPASFSLRASPVVGLLNERLYVGATAAALFHNPGLEGVFGPRASLRVKRIAPAGFPLVDIHLGSEMLWGSKNARLYGGFLSLDVPTVASITVHAGREPRWHQWRTELSLGLHLWRTQRIRAPHVDDQPPLALRQSLRAKASTKLKAWLDSHQDKTARESLRDHVAVWRANPPADLTALQAKIAADGFQELADGLAAAKKSAMAEFHVTAIDEAAFVSDTLDQWNADVHRFVN